MAHTSWPEAPPDRRSSTDGVVNVAICGSFRRDPDDETAKQSAVDKVRDVLGGQPEMTLDQVVAAVGYTDRTVRKALRELGAEPTRAGSQGEKTWALDGGLAP